MISIHAPARGATFIVICMAAINLISIHAPARGATGCQIPPALLPTLFQSTLPQGERRQWGASAEMGVKISIHAPARGATDCRRLKSIQFAISIHAPARGATGLEDFIASITAYFNPRSRKGSDVPIRIPVQLQGNFNPRSRKGSDQLQELRQDLIDYFNPRSRKGSDRYIQDDAAQMEISIHAPARGAT